MSVDLVQPFLLWEEANGFVCHIMYGTGAINKGHDVPGIIDKADGHKGLGDIWGIQYVPKGDI